MSGNKQSVLITGGLGNLGAWITDHLLQLNRYGITVLSKTKKALELSGSYEFLTADISDLDSLSDALKGKKFDFVIHLASVNETFIPNYGELALKVNSLGTKNLLECIKEQHIKKFIYFSTFHVYGKSDGTITEKDQPDPQNDYAMTHLLAEKHIEMYHKNSGLPYLIFRLSNSYGCPKDRSNSKWYLLFNDLCRSAYENKKIVLHTNGKAMRDFIYMGDVCRIVEESLQNRMSNETINLGSGQSYSLLEIAHHILEAYREVYDKKIPIEINESDKKTYNGQLNFSVEKLQKIYTIQNTNALKQEAKKIFKLLEQN